LLILIGCWTGLCPLQSRLPNAGAEAEVPDAGRAAAAGLRDAARLALGTAKAVTATLAASSSHGRG
jgi:hypothetical protein